MKRCTPIGWAGLIIGSAAAVLAHGQAVDFNAEYSDDSNTVALWHFNGNAANSAAFSSGIPALTLQGPTTVLPTGGRFGGALSVGGDGGGAYIFDTDFPQLDPAILTSSFTIEMWIQPTASDLDPVLRPSTPFLTQYKSFDTPNIADSGRGLDFRIQNSVFDDANSPGLLYGRSGEPPLVGTAIGDRGLGILAGWDTPTKDPDVPLTVGEWNHVAVTRESNTWRLWINGSRVAETVGAWNPPPSTEPLIVGAVEQFIRPMFGMIDEVRISKVARDPSQAGYLEAPFVDDTNTVGLWHFDGSGANAAAAASPTAVMSLKTNSSIPASGGKFGGALAVGGGGQGEGGAFIDNASIPELNQTIVPQMTTMTVGAALFPASAGPATPKNFTLEAWVKPASVDVVANQGHVTTGILEHYDSDVASNRAFDLRIDNLDQGTANRPVGTKGLAFFRSGDFGGGVVTGTAGGGMGLLDGQPTGPEIPLVVDVWNHVAITRENTLWKMWVNGQQVAQVTSSWQIPNSTAPFIIGAVQSFIRPLGGMVDEVRVSKVARDPSALGYLDAPFADDASTVGLWHFDGNGLNAAASASPTAVVNLQGASSFAPSGGKFGGALNVGSLTGAQNSGGGYINDANIPELDQTIAGPPTPGEDSGTTLVADTWTHIGITRQANTWKMWVNGVVVSQTQCEVTPQNGSRPLLIGAGEGGAVPLAGSIDEVRISKVARDLSVIPATPYNDDADTVALWHLDGNGSSAAGASPAATVQTQGAAVFSASDGRFGGALNANSAGGSVPDADAPAIDAALTGGDFTIECFVKAAAADLSGTASPGILNKYLPPQAVDETIQLRIDNNDRNTSGRQVGLKGVPYFRTGEGVNIVTGCGTAQVPGRADFTLEAWVKPAPEDLDPNTRITTGILEHYRGGGDLAPRVFDLRIDNNDAGAAGRPTSTRGLVHLRSGEADLYTAAFVNGIGLLSDGKTSKTARPAVTLQPGVWAHVAWTREWVDPGDDLWRLWVNDQLVAQLVGDFAIPDSFEPLVIGAGEDATPVNQPPGTNWLRPLHGLIDEVRISKTAYVFGDVPCDAIVQVDFDCDGDVDLQDVAAFAECATRAALPYDPAALPAGCTLSPTGGIIAADVDADGDVDEDDYGRLQRCYSGPGVAPSPDCLN